MTNENEVKEAEAPEGASAEVVSEPEVYGPEKPHTLRPKYIGKRFTGNMRARENGSLVVQKISKAERRIIRKKAMAVLNRRGGKTHAIEKEVADSLARKQEAQREASNSHEAKRVVESERIRDREMKLANGNAHRIAEINACTNMQKLSKTSAADQLPSRAERRAQQKELRREAKKKLKQADIAQKMYNAIGTTK